MNYHRYYEHNMVASVGKAEFFSFQTIKYYILVEF